ncbi:MAG: hypothetical protein GXX85_13430 [Ignavibacteria bacterium]|mgnify:CR=1 FL=1|nr:hypothetical protein [Ignavibacteria bacterium]
MDTEFTLIRDENEELEIIRNENPILFDEVQSYRKDYESDWSCQHLFEFRDDNPPRKLTKEENEFLTKLIDYFQERRSKAVSSYTIRIFKTSYPRFYNLVEERFFNTLDRLANIKHSPEIEKFAPSIFSGIIELLEEIILNSDYYMHEIDDFEKGESDSLLLLLDYIFWLNDLSLSVYDGKFGELKKQIKNAKNESKSYKKRYDEMTGRQYEKDDVRLYEKIIAEQRKLINADKTGHSASLKQAVRNIKKYAGEKEVSQIAQNVSRYLKNIKKPKKK